VSAGDDPCVFAELRQKPERLVERAGPMIGERRGSFAIPSLLVGVLPFLVYPAGLSNAAGAKREKPQVAGGPDDDGSRRGRSQAKASAANEVNRRILQLKIPHYGVRRQQDRSFRST